MTLQTNINKNNDTALNVFDVIMHGMKELALLREQISACIQKGRVSRSKVTQLNRTADLLDEFIQQSFVRSQSILSNAETFSIKQAAIKQGHHKIQNRIVSMVERNKLHDPRRLINEKKYIEH